MILSSKPAVFVSNHEFWSGLSTGVVEFSELGALDLTLDKGLSDLLNVYAYANYLKLIIIFKFLQLLRSG